jgi:hypothetical protein
LRVASIAATETYIAVGIEAQRADFAAFINQHTTVSISDVQPRGVVSRRTSHARDWIAK